MGGAKVKRSLSVEAVEEIMAAETEAGFSLTRKEKRLAANVVKKVRELMEACEGYEKRSSVTNLSLKWN